MKQVIGVILGFLLLAHTAVADQVLNDDHIIQASECIGVDCVNGETFGFDTLILKENNLRILFNDTSGSASFPYIDWRLVANDTTNGGRNHFSIENATSGEEIFTLLAGAPASSLVVAASDDFAQQAQALIAAFEANPARQRASAREQFRNLSATHASDLDAILAHFKSVAQNSTAATEHTND